MQLRSRRQTMNKIKLGDKFEIRARAVPGAWWDRDKGAYVINGDDVTGRAAIVALTLFPELSITHPVLVEARDSLIQEVRPFDNATPFNQRPAAAYIEARLAEDEHAFFEFQALDIGYVAAVLREHGAAYIGWERGLGKTLATYALAESIEARSLLVICSNTAKEAVWEQEAQEFWPWKVEVLPNEKKKRNWCMERVRERKKADEPVLLIVHYEALNIIATDGNKAGRGWDKYGAWDLTAADEFHRFKNGKAKMTRSLKKIPTRHRLGLSGSIIENHAEELYSPLNWLFPDRYKSKWRDWNDRFLDYVEGPYGQICVGIKLDRLEELQNELGVFMVYRRKKDELVDLPERTDETRLLTLSPGQRAAYDELEQTCITSINEDETLVVAQEGLAMLTKLRQIATGLDLLDEDVRDSTKLDFAVDMIADNPEGVFVVFSWYKSACSALAKRLHDANIDSWVVTGDVKAKDRPGRIKRFMAGEKRVFIGTLSTLGESVNLQRADNAIFLDRSWNPATNVQAADRIYRIGQEKPVTITYLVSKDTVDEYNVLPTIKNKEALRAIILGAS
jgi:SNF2 family DNA or RNA helicase